MSTVHIHRLLHRKHNVATTRKSIFKFVKRYSSTGVLAPATRRENNRFPRKLTDFHRRCIDKWLYNNKALTLEALVERLFVCLKLWWQLRTYPRYAKPWVGAQGHYRIGSCSATRRHFVAYSCQWMHLDPKKHLITSSLLMRLLLRCVLMGGFSIQEKFIFGFSAS